MRKKKPTTKSGTKNPPPSLAFFHRQRATRYDSAALESLVRSALPACAGLASPLPQSIDISVIGNRAMAAIHRDFLGISGPTDVITFPYGEIFICAPVAAARASEFAHSTTTELALYAIHGLLHLAGLDDVQPADAALMAREQSRILAAAQKSSV